MTVYLVFAEMGDDEPILRMEAENPRSVPTSVTGDPGMVDWAMGYVAAHRSVGIIASGCGYRSVMVREDGKSEPNPKKNGPRFSERYLAERDAKVAKTAPDDITLTAEGLICKADEEQQPQPPHPNVLKKKVPRGRPGLRKR